MTSHNIIYKRNKHKSSYDNRRFLVAIFILIFGIYNHPLLGQMQDFSEKDNETLAESEQLKSEAEQLQITANDLYLEAAMLEQNENFASDKKIQKEYKKNQDDAQKTELKAAEKFEEANKIKINIYQKYINDFWKSFYGDESVLTNARLIEETSKEYFVRASTARDDGKRIDNQTEKFLKLSEAYEYELIGIEKLQTAYNIYKNWPDIEDNDSSDDNINFQISDTYIDENYSETEETDNSTSDIQEETQSGYIEEPINSEPTNIYESTNTYISENQTISETTSNNDVQINSGQVDKILRYMEEENDTVYYLANGIEGYDMESIRKFWDNYRNVEYTDEPDQYLAENKEESADIETTTEEFENENISVNTTSENITQTKTSTENKQNANTDTEVEIGKVTETVVPDPDSKIIYRIQIAAEKAPLSQGMLQKLFYAKHKIAMVDEGGWYKYSIGEFDNFSDADEFRKTLNRDDAFVVAYRDAINVQYLEKDETTKSQGTVGVVMAKKRPDINAEDITFVVQIAASRETMSESSLKRLYNGDLPIKSRLEDNWYKYQIGETNSYLDIKEIRKTVDVKGAFIVAYNGDTKLKLWQAIRIVHSSDDKIMFVLQIAASKTKLSDEKINSIFSGNDYVIEIYEEGWYKYHIVCGNTYDAARRFKNLWGIKNAFIVAYKNNTKIDIRQAIKETSN